jgi:alpha-glucuronidase
MTKNIILAVLLLIGINGTTKAENGYRLWLRYNKINKESVYKDYRSRFSQLIFTGQSPMLNAAREELQTGLSGLLGLKLKPGIAPANGALIIGTPASSKLIAGMPLATSLRTVGPEGFLIQSLNLQGKTVTVISANSDAGVLYGVFHFLKLLQTNTNISNLSVSESPTTKLRLLNHWDNLNRSVERGYAGLSLWDWNALPDVSNPRYKDYARANASIGINGTVLTNVNADAKILTKAYLEKAAALANVFRSYHLKVYLTARFSAPIEIGGLKTADPLDPAVQKWWKDKVDEIYKYIPDFGGLLVKANSEGQPGPQNYGRTHADGANMFADALAPHGGGGLLCMTTMFRMTAPNRLIQNSSHWMGSSERTSLYKLKMAPLIFNQENPSVRCLAPCPKRLK